MSLGLNFWHTGSREEVRVGGENVWGTSRERQIRLLDIKLLNIEETSAFNWFNPEATKGYVLLNNITDDVYNYATVGVDIERKVTRVHVYFDGAKPV